MKRAWWKLWLAVATALLILSLQAGAVAGTADLLQALDEGTVWAEFRGTGELGVDAVIGRTPGGPQFVTIAPGTQFWAQMPGRQGMTTLGWVPVDLSRQSVAQLRIPTACTNITRRAPTPDDEMYPSPPRDVRLARVTGFVHPDEDDINAVQVAVWAVANNASRGQVLRYADDMLDPQLTDEQAREAAFDALLASGAKLLERAGIQPTGYRLFR